MPGCPILVAFLFSLFLHGALAAQDPPNLPLVAESSLSPTGSGPTLNAASWLSKSRQTLMNTYSLRARIEQRGKMSTLPFVSRGIYEAGRFPLVRLEMAIRLGTLEGRLTEVCDGQVLWTAREVRGLPPQKDSDDTEREDSSLPPGTELLVSRRDIDLISQALAGSEQTVEQVLAAELGVGGLPSLLAGLEWGFDYRTSSQNEETVVFSGVWKAKVREKLLIAQNARIPSEVEIAVRPNVPVPERVTYYTTDENGRTPILQMQFSEIVFGEDVAEERFRYVPPSGVEVTNLTPGVISEIESANKTAEAE